MKCTICSRCDLNGSFHEGKVIDKEHVGILSAALLFLIAETHVHFVSLQILCVKLLSLFVPQQLPSDKL